MEQEARSNYADGGSIGKIQELGVDGGHLAELG